METEARVLLIILVNICNELGNKEKNTGILIIGFLEPEPYRF